MAQTSEHIFTPQEYNALGYVDECDDSDRLSVYISRAEIIVNLLTEAACDRIDALPEYQREQLTKAVAFQTEYYVHNGIDDEAEESTRVSLGDFSYSTDISAADRLNCDICATTMLILKQCGLFYRCCEVRG